MAGRVPPPPKWPEDLVLQILAPMANCLDSPTERAWEHLITQVTDWCDSLPEAGSMSHEYGPFASAVEKLRELCDESVTESIVTKIVCVGRILAITVSALRRSNEDLFSVNSRKTLVQALDLVLLGGVLPFLLLPQPEGRGTDIMSVLSKQKNLFPSWTLEAVNSYTRPNANYGTVHAVYTGMFDESEASIFDYVLEALRSDFYLSSLVAPERVVQLLMWALLVDDQKLQKARGWPTSCPLDATYHLCHIFHPSIALPAMVRIRAITETVPRETNQNFWRADVSAHLDALLQKKDGLRALTDSVVPSTEQFQSERVTRLLQLVCDTSRSEDARTTAPPEDEPTEFWRNICNQCVSMLVGRNVVHQRIAQVICAWVAKHMPTVFRTFVLRPLVKCYDPFFVALEEYRRGNAYSNDALVQEADIQQSVEAISHLLCPKDADDYVDNGRQSIAGHLREYMPVLFKLYCFSKPRKNMYPEPTRHIVKDYLALVSVDEAVGLIKAFVIGRASHYSLGSGYVLDNMQLQDIGTTHVRPGHHFNIDFASADDGGVILAVSQSDSAQVFREAEIAVEFLTDRKIKMQILLELMKLQVKLGDRRDNSGLEEMCAQDNETASVVEDPQLLLSVLFLVLEKVGDSLVDTDSVPEMMEVLLIMLDTPNDELMEPALAILELLIGQDLQSIAMGRTLTNLQEKLSQVRGREAEQDPDSPLITLILDMQSRLQAVQNSKKPGKTLSAQVSDEEAMGEIEEQSPEPDNAVAWEEIMTLIRDPLIPVRGAGVLQLRDAVKKAKRSPEIKKELDERKDLLVKIFQVQVQHQDTYLYLAAIDGLAHLCDVYPEDVFNLCAKRYEEIDLSKSSNDRKYSQLAKLGDVIIRASRLRGDMLAHQHAPLLMNIALRGCRSAQAPERRATSLSLLATLMPVLGTGANVYVVEVFRACQAMIQQQSSVLDRRGAALVLYEMIAGLKERLLEMLAGSIGELKRSLQYALERETDGTAQTHLANSVGALQQVIRETIVGGETEARPELTIRF
eukprot:Clim_evm143s149 gene=Clim_evmTU143s149